ncbi:MAG: ABC transporter permease [Candidatus Saccharimonas sp.]|nr:ABC transporter permease [Planctomycetaceae bacterium]
MSHAPDPRAADSPAPSARPASSLPWRTAFDLLRPFLALVVVTALFCAADWWINQEKASFYTSRSMRTVAAQTATVAVAALGMTVIIIAGGIDLSVGTAIALCATVLAWSLKEDVVLLVAHGDNVAGATQKLKAALAELDRSKNEPETTAGKELVDRRKQHLERTQAASRRWTRWTPCLALGLALGCGCLCGLVNGALVSYLRLVPFIVTLGTMQVYLGLAKMIAAETTVRPDNATQVPAWFGDLLSVRPQALWLGLPSGVWFTLVLAVVLSAVLHFTVFGRYVFALGSNEATARLCGINVRWNKIAVYALSGLFVGIAGLYQFSRLTVGNPTSGSGLELKVIASVVIGGGSLNGGRGSVLGTLTGALIMSVITSGCTALGLTNPIQDMILGIIIVAAVTIDQLRQRKQAT